VKIGELALVARCTVETVRYDENEGLLPAPARTAANYPRSGDSHFKRLRFIRNCRALDMTHGEIRTPLGRMDLSGDDCGGVNQLLDEHISHVDVRIVELSQRKQQRNELRQHCQSKQGTNACGILRGLASVETQPRPDRPTHRGCVRKPAAKTASP